MKRIIIGVVLVGMFGWAVYQFVDKPETAEPEEDESEYRVEEDQGSNPDEESGKEGVIVAPDEDGVEGLEAGNVAPDFELETLDGETVKLSDYRGERVMLNFWATWCPPCRAEMPDMQKFHEDTDVQILAVNLTETKKEKENIPDFVDEFGLTFPILLDEELEAATLYQIQPIPTTYLIDSKGVIHNKSFGALNYDQMVQEYEAMN